MKKRSGVSNTYQLRIGRAVERARLERGWTQAELAERAGTSQSAIHRIEKGQQNVSLDMVKRLSEILERQILSVADEASQSYVIHGGKTLRGAITVNTSKNAAVGLLCASLLNVGRTVLKGLAKIEEVYRIIEVLESVGVKLTWVNGGKDLEIISPDELKLEKMNVEAARRTRSILMFMGPLLHRYEEFELPYAGGCSLGTRTIEPHLKALSEFGLKVDARGKSGFYKVTVDREGLVSTGADGVFETKKVVLIERGDTVTENVLMAAAKYPG